MQVKLAHRSGELARAASRLGEAKINIEHTYCGLEPGSNAPLVIFGFKEEAMDRAMPILEELAAKAA
jgi:hypothetical protein